jgi:AcrR family transcriptional regulator
VTVSVADQPKNGRTPRRSDATRAKLRRREIIEAAAEIFHRKGYSETSVQDIAEAVGILKGSLYYYIDSKEDLLFQMLLEVHEGAKGIV